MVDNASAYTWVVDPIDGTSNFASGVPMYGVMIGLLEGAVPIAGGMALPSFEQSYVAIKGGGAFCNDRPIRTSSEPGLLQTLVAYGIDGHQENPQLTHDETALLAKIILAARNLRTSNSAYDFALVADGRYGVYLNRTSKIWDNVAPHIIIEEAGGRFADFFGKPIDYSDPLHKVDQNFTTCAASPWLHDQLQHIIHQG